MINWVSRRISVQAPWVFKSAHSTLFTQKISTEQETDIKQKAENLLIKKFNEYCDALVESKFSNLRDSIESGLKANVESQLRGLNSSGYYFKRINNEKPELKVLSLDISLGVNIERHLNLAKPDYFFVGNAEQMKSFALSASSPEKAREIEDHDPSGTSLKNLWYYLHPKAPNNIIISLLVEFTSKSPITLVKNDKDIIYTDPTIENHFFLLETEPIRSGTIEDALSSGFFNRVLKVLDEDTTKLLDREWTIADVDNILNSNPFIKE